MGRASALVTSRIVSRLMGWRTRGSASSTPSPLLLGPGPVRRSRLHTPAIRTSASPRLFGQGAFIASGFAIGGALGAAGDFGSGADLFGAGAEGVAEGGSPWFAVTNAAADRPGTFVPTSFDLSVAGEDFSVVPNATKHLAEYATSTGAGRFPISPLAAAVETAVNEGLLGPVGTSSRSETGSLGSIQPTT